MTETEEIVALDGTADGSAGLVPFQTGFRFPDQVAVPGVGAEQVVAIVIPG